MAIIKAVTENDLGTGLSIVDDKLVTDIDPQVVLDLITLTGVSANSADFGSKFTGSIISDNANLCVALQEIETAIETENVTGQYAGSAATFADLPTQTDDGNVVNNGDWAILNTDDGANQAGIYAFDGVGYQLAKEIPEMFTLSVATTDNDCITWTGDGSPGSPLVANLKVATSITNNLLKTIAGDGKAVDLNDIKDELTFDCELQDLTGNTLGYLSSTPNFA